MADITGNQTVRMRMPVGTASEIDAAKKKGVFAFDTTAGTAAVCPSDGANFVRLGLHPSDAPAASSLNGADLVLIVQGGALKHATVAAISGGGGWQPLDSDLTAIAALSTTPFGRSLLTLADAPAARVAIGAASAADLAGYQPLDSDLTAIAALTTTSFGRSLLALADGPAVRAAIGAGTVDPSDLAAYQPLDSDLTAIAALSTAPFGRNLLTQVDAASARAAIGAGTSSFSGAYPSLSSIPAAIDAIDGLVPSADRIPYYTGASTGALAVLTAFARTLLDDTDAVAALSTLGALPSVDPVFSGTLVGPRTTLSEFGVFREYPGISTIGALYPTGVSPQTGSNYAIALFDDGSKAYFGASTEVGFVLGGADKVIVTASSVKLGSGVELNQNGITRITASGDSIFASVRATGLANAAVRPAVVGTDGTIGAQDAATFRSTIDAAASAHTHTGTYLPVSNPTFTGVLTGPSATLTSFGFMRADVGSPATHTAIFPVGIVPSANNYAFRMAADGTSTGVNAATSVNLRIGAANKVVLTSDSLTMQSGVSLKVQGTTAIDQDRKGSFLELYADTLTGSGDRPVLAGSDGLLKAVAASSFRSTIGAAAAPTASDKSGNWSLDTNTTRIIRITGSGTLTLPAASSSYLGEWTISATGNFTLTVSGTFCYLDAVNSASYWYDITSGSQAFAMNGAHASGNRKKIEIWCDGSEWFVRC